MFSSPKVIKTHNFFVIVLFHISIIQTLTNNFRGLHKNMNCVFPLRFTLLILDLSSETAIRGVYQKKLF